MSNMQHTYIAALSGGHSVGLNRNELRIVLSLGGYFGWLLCFAMFGPALGLLASSAQVNVPSLLQIFLPCHGLSLLLFGLLRVAQKPFAKTAQRVAISVCTALTIVIANARPSDWTLLTLALAVASALPVIYYAPHLARTARLSHRSRTIGYSMAFANVILYLFSLSMPRLAAMGTNAPAILSVGLLSLPFFIDLQIEEPRYEEETHGSRPFVLTWHLIYLLIAFFMVAGLAYQLVYPAVMASSTAVTLVGVTPYILTTAIVGAAIDRLGHYAWMVPVGLGLMGSSIALYGATDRLAIAVLSHILIQAGYGVADLFLWTYLTHSAQPGAESRQFGLGLALNLGSLYLGLVASVRLLPLFDLPASTAAVIGIVFLFLAVPIWSRMPVPESRPQPANLDITGLGQRVLRDFELTSRQEEIFLLILQGLSNDEISVRLHISPNTVKTHLRNLYAKTGTANRKDLILLAASDTSSSSR